MHPAQVRVTKIFFDWRLVRPQVAAKLRGLLPPGKDHLHPTFLPDRSMTRQIADQTINLINIGATQFERACHVLYCVTDVRPELLVNLLNRFQ